jgi:Helix-turn-helix
MNYIERIPERHHESFTVLAIEALKHAWPAAVDSQSGHTRTSGPHTHTPVQIFSCHVTHAALSRVTPCLCHVTPGSARHLRVGEQHQHNEPGCTAIVAGAAEISGFSQQYISSLERGRRNPTVITLYELSIALGVNAPASPGKMSRFRRIECAGNRGCASGYWRAQRSRSRPQP